MNIMIDQPQILYFRKIGLQSIVNIVPKIVLLEFLKNIYFNTYSLKLKCVCHNDWD
jgi:hypothetical protein